MKYKKTLLLFFLIICIFSASGVWASDNSTEIISSAQNDEVITADNAGTFTELQNLIDNTSNSTIILDKDYLYDEGFSTNGITVSKPLTIDANSHTIDGASKSRIFNLTSDNIILKNIMFKGGNASEYGGAVYSENNYCSIISCNFTQSSSYDGGAVYNMGDNFIVSSCDFTLCSATYLGAIYTFGDNCTVSSCSFTNCSSKVGSGAIVNIGEDCSIILCDFVNCSSDVAQIFNYGERLTISLCNFTDCRSRSVGGAIRNTEENCSISSCKFINCHAYSDGGAISNNAPYCSIISCDFTDCNATNGGAINNMASDCSISSCNFINITADEAGGAICMYEEDSSISSCNFINVHATDGGAIHVSSGDTSISLSNFTGCSGKKNGGAVFNSAGSCTISSCNFEDCKVISFWGGAIVNQDNATCTLNYCNFSKCEADVGGAIYNHDYSELYINYCNFIDCKANFGGAIDTNASVDWFIGVVNIKYSNFANCYAKTRGGALWNDGQMCEVISCYLANCRSKFEPTVQKGALENEWDEGGKWVGKTTESNCVRDEGTFTDLQKRIDSASPGSTLYLMIDYSYDDAFTSDSVLISKELTIDGKFLSHLSTTIDAQSKSRIFTVNADNVRIENIAFKGGSKSLGGGAISVRKSGLTVDSCEFNNCDSSDGGAIYIDMDVENTVINSCEFTDCYSTSDGGALYNFWGGAWNVTSCNFTNCYADDGGVIYNRVNYLNIDSCDFTDCHASRGGAVYNMGQYLNISSCNYINCYSRSMGAAIYNDGFYGSVSSSYFEKCYTDEEKITIKAAISDEFAPMVKKDCTYDECTFSDLQKLIDDAEPGSTILLNADYINYEGFSQDGIIINKTLTIDGNNNKIDAKLKSRIFDIKSDNVVLKNIIFIGGNATNGGAVYNNGENSTISSCNFTECSADNGGAVYNKVHNLTVNSCDFTDCSAYNGGVVYNEGFDCSMTSCNFSQCFATNGGVVFDEGNDFIISSCNFSDCSADNGGAVYNNAGNLILLSCDFNYCNATDGGVIYNGGKGLNISKCDFTGSKAVNGGSIYNQASNINMESCNFTDSSADKYGGAVYNNNTGDYCIMDSCNFINCSARISGGAVYNAAFNSTLNSCAFTNCSADDGGAVYNEGVNYIIDSCDFKGCYANKSGGAISNNASDAIISSCDFTDCEATNGGSLYNIMDDCIINQCDFTGSYADEKGAAIYNSGRNCNITSSYFGKCYTDEEKTSKKAAIYDTTGNLTLEDCIYDDGTFTSLQDMIDNAKAGSTLILRQDFVYDEGFSQEGIIINKTLTIDGNNHIIDGQLKSRIFYLKSDNVTLKNIVFLGGSAEDGGAICKLNADNSVISSCNFINCSASEFGGAIANKGNASYISSCNFTNCQAVNGGAIYNYYNGDNCIISSCNFINCNATDGGAITNKCNDVIISSCNFTNCSAGKNGGAIENTFKNCNISSCDFTNCAAVEKGGAVFNNYADGCIINSCNFTDCTCEISGGAIYNTVSNNCNISSCDFTGCYAVSYGGSIFNDGSDLIVSSCDFTDSSTSSTGGAICNYGENFIVSSCDFTNCSSKYAGAIDSFGAESTVSYCDFINCSADLRGGAIYNNANCNITSCDFINCSADEDGGAIFYGDGICNIGSCNFTDCSAGICGGAIYGGTSTDCNFTGNTAVYGGAICNGVAWECTFVNNTAANGQAMYSGDAILCIFENNTCNNTGFYPVINVSDFKSRYGSGEKLLFNLTYHSQLLNGINTTIRIYKNDTLIGTYYCLSGEGWPVNLAPGAYEAVLSLDKYSSVKPANATLLISMSETYIESLPVMTVYSKEDYLVATLKDSYGKAMAGFNLTIDFNGAVKEYTTDKNGTVRLSTLALAAGNYTAKITFKGNEGYKKSNATVKVTVNKANTSVIINNISGFVYGENVNVTFDVVNRTTVNVAVIDSYRRILIENVSGNTVYLGRLDTGNYTIVITNVGNQNFSSSASSRNFTVRNKDISLLIFVNDSVYGENIKGTVYASIDGEYNVTAGTYKGTVTVSNNVGFFNIGTLDSGNYKASVEFIGDDYYNPTSNSTSFKVIPQETALKLEANATDILYGDSVKVSVKNISRGATGKIKYYLDNGTLLGEVDINETLTLRELNAGSYKIIGNYSGDKNHKSAADIISIDVEKLNTTITAESEVNNATVTIKVNVNPQATGVVAIGVLGQTFVVPVKDGKAVFTFDFAYGNYTADVSYLGDDNFNNASTETSFNVTEQKTELKNTTIDANVEIVENNVTITVNVDSNATGLVKFNVTGAETYVVYKDVVNGKAFLEDVLTPGNYSVIITYLGDEKYESNSTTEEFSVMGHIKKDTEITAVSDVNGSTVTIVVNVDSNATGVVAIAVLGQTFVVQVNEGKAVFAFDFLPGVYNADVSYLGDDNFNNASTTTVFTVTEEKTDLKNTTIDVDVVSFENDVNITATVDKLATGLVEFNINGRSVYIAVNNGKAVLSTILPAGDYNLVATYLGDSKFNANSTSEKFTIRGHVKKNTTIKADVVIDDYNVTVTVSVDSDATGFVEFSMNGESIFAEVKDGKAAFNAFVLPGNYTITATYLGDEDFNANATDISFAVKEIPLKNTTISANVEIDKNNVTITVNVDKNATGMVKFDVSGAETYVVYMDVVDGTAVLEDYLDAGNYSAVITYLGDKNYNSNSTTEKFTVTGHIKKDTEITAVPGVNGTTVTITSTVDSNATGFVAIDVLGETFIVPVNDGEAVFTFDFLPGIYSADVTYLGDDNFNNASTSVSFTVTEEKVDLKNTTIDLSVVSFENNVNITAVLDKLATGLVEFNINGRAVYIAVNNGKAVLSTILPAGDYNVVATYLGDSKFNPNSTSQAFTITGHVKKNVTITTDVSVDDGAVTVTVDIDKDATGDILVNVDGTGYYAPIEDGTAVVKINGLKPGNYTADVIFEGDDNFNPANATAEIAIPEAVLKNPDLAVSVDGTLISVTINENATGLVIVTVGGTSFAFDASEAIEFDVDYFIPGTYDVIAAFYGDDVFAPANATAKVTVPEVVPEDSNLTATAVNSTITVTVNEKATGNVLVDVDGTGYYAPIKDGHATVNVIGLDEGEYEATVTYPGDNNFKAANTTVAVTVPSSGKNDTPVDPKADFNISADGIEITLPEDATGYVLADVDGKTSWAPVENGKASIDLPDLTPGNHTVTVTYTGDKKYSSANASEVITVEAVETIFSKDLTKIEKAPDRFEANFTDKEGKTLANATVTFEINGNVYTRTTDVNGKAGMNINLEPGNYTIKITNPVTGEVKNNTITVLSRFEDTNDLVKYFRNESQYVITVLADDGKIAPNGTVVTFNINGVFYNRTVNESGQVKLNINLNPGEYIVTAEYKGCRVSNIITVLPVLTGEDLTKKFGEAGAYEATLVDGQGNPYANQTITLNINGVFYERTTNEKGVAKLNINLMPGEYIITATHGYAAISNNVTVTA